MSSLSGLLVPVLPEEGGLQDPSQSPGHILRWALPHPLQKELRLIWERGESGCSQDLIFFPHLSRTTFLKNGQDFAFSASRGQLPAQQGGSEGGVCTCVYMYEHVCTRVYMCVHVCTCVCVCAPRVLMLPVFPPGPPEWLLFHVTGRGLLPDLWTPGLGQVCARP